MKLSTKAAVFCPGCPKKELSLQKTSPTLTVKMPEKKDTQIITIVSSSKAKKTTSNSLF